jgi:hypothetical protein
VYPDPQDNITPLKNAGSMISSVLSIIPFTGPVAGAAGAVNKGLGFVLAHATPPEPVNKFLAWSNVAGSMGDVIRDFQAAVSNSVDTILDAEIDDPTNGISKFWRINHDPELHWLQCADKIIEGGAFLGLNDNFTQTDLQAVVLDSITMNALGLALQAQKIFIFRNRFADTCPRDASDTLCSDNGDGSSTVTLLTRADGDDNALDESALSDTLQSKYGMTKEQIIQGPIDCLEANGGKQLTNPFDQGGLPADPKGPCVFNVLVCIVETASINAGIVERCRDIGLDI